jgi:hypothetical protein
VVFAGGCVVMACDGVGVGVSSRVWPALGNVTAREPGEGST